MSSIIDHDQRLEAIRTDQSFCVSAPAGSGKTELLIQRYLALLARVARPEQILAITFTRKAAAEMRERVLLALHNARDNAPCESEHLLLTRRLAESALAADERGNWQLLRNISRLNIKTIDSFCLALTRQMPVLSNFGGHVTPLDDSEPLYVAAVEELFALLDTEHPVAADLHALLLQFDNDWARVQELLIAMLRRRQQWRMYVGVHNSPDASEAYLVSVVEDLVRDELQQAERLLQPYSGGILQLMQFAASNLGQPEPVAFPTAQAGDLQLWRALQQMLQTQSGTWRKSVTVNNGFPADKTEPAMSRKAQIKDLLAELATIEGLEECLAGVVNLPEIAAGSDSWRLVLHLSRLLPALAAQLVLVFREHGAVDYSQVAEAALAALGSEQAPSELALRLDYLLEHILIDEFQDTSINQFELLEKLTQGWLEHNAANPDAQRTLLIVGDAMQSIYGFRDANVGLFLKAREEGINGIALKHLELKCNFRSDPGLVSWVNATFSGAFPAADDTVGAQVSYSAATAVNPAGEGVAVSLDAFCGDEARAAEVEFICDSIARCVEAGERDIAVLGRQRSHLHPISQRLKAMGIRCQAQDLDSLARSPVVADLLSLCRALANDADRLAWLALLRAPWCGLTLRDLLVVAHFGDAAPQRALRWTLQDTDLAEALSEDGRARLAHLRQALARAGELRDRLALRVWIEQLWLELGGARCVDDEPGMQDAESFMRLLERADSEGRGLDVAWLQREVETRFMSGGDADCPVQIMTLHKAKGLEFDRVFIPRLNGVPRNNTKDLLLWDEHNSPSGGRAFLLAADDHSDKAAPTLYRYLQLQRKLKSRQEATRLLYVGTTRAIRCLHLSAGINWDEAADCAKAPPSGSLLNTIWPTFSAEMAVRAVLPGQADGAATHAPLRRLTRASLPAPRTERANLLPADNFPEQPDNHYERSIGTVVHLALEELSLCTALPDSVTAADRTRWRDALQREGVLGNHLEQALSLVVAAAEHALAPGGEGRWILDASHAEARSEWALTVVEDGQVRDIVIDRTFIDRDTGLRWIVDFKTSQPVEGEALAAFTARETAHYREQLARYRAALLPLGAEPVRCALYFTGLPLLHVVDDAELDGGPA